MSKIPSLKDILNDIPDDVSEEEEEEEYYQILPQQPQPQKQKFLDLPEEYTRLNPIPSQPPCGVAGSRQVSQSSYVLPLTEKNLEKVSKKSDYEEDQRSMISHHTHKTHKTQKSDHTHKTHETHKTHHTHHTQKTHKTHETHKTHHTQPSWFLEEEQKVAGSRQLCWDPSDPQSCSASRQKSDHKERRVREDDDRSVISKISALSMGSIKPIDKNEKKKKSGDSYSHISVSSLSSYDVESESSSEYSKSVKSSSKKREKVPIYKSAIHIPVRESQHPKSQSEVSDMEMNELKMLIRLYIEKDNRVKRMRAELREEVKELKAMEAKISEYMKSNDITTITSKSDKSRIDYLEKESKSSITREYMYEKLYEMLKNESTADAISRYIYENRDVKVKSMIKRKV